MIFKNYFSQAMIFKNYFMMAVFLARRRIGAHMGARWLATRAASAQFGRVGDGFIERLGRACARVSTNGSILQRHGDDESHHVSAPSASPLNPDVPPARPL
jgi:hypothetical protein